MLQFVDLIISLSFKSFIEHLLVFNDENFLVFLVLHHYKWNIFVLDKTNYKGNFSDVD